jgi:hypothetical protein
MIEITAITLVVLAIVFVAMGPKPSHPPEDDKTKPEAGKDNDPAP